MSEFFKMNLFFVIATIGFVVLALLVCIALWYVIQILRTISRVANSVEEEAQILKEDFNEARASIRRQGRGFLSGLSVFGKFANKTGKRLMKKKHSS